MKLVSKKMMDECTSAYGKSIKGQGTTSVSFDSKELAEWVRKVAPHCARIEVRFGTYTSTSAPEKSLSGKNTVFFYACDEDGNPAVDESGEEIEIINHGQPIP